MGTGLLAAAAGFVIAANNALPILVVKTVPQTISHAVVVGTGLDPVLAISLQAQNKPVRVKRLIFNVIGDSDGTFASVENNVTPADHISNCQLWDLQGHSLTAPVLVDNLGRAIFENLDLTIPANAGRGYSLHCTFANVPPDGSSPDIYAFSVNSDTDVSAENGQGSALPGARIYIGETKRSRS